MCCITTCAHCKSSPPTPAEIRRFWCISPGDHDEKTVVKLQEQYDILHGARFQHVSGHARQDKDKDSDFKVDRELKKMGITAHRSTWRDMHELAVLNFAWRFLRHRKSLLKEWSTGLSGSSGNNSVATTEEAVPEMCVPNASPYMWLEVLERIHRRLKD